MNTNLFEAHITVDAVHADRLQRVSKGLIGWKFSKIDGDPIMGLGTRCYLTAYDKDDKQLLTRMKSIVVGLELIDIPHLRQKIEHIVFDTSTGVDRINHDNI